MVIYVTRDEKWKSGKVWGTTINDVQRREWMDGHAKMDTPCRENMRTVDFHGRFLECEF